MRTPGRRAAATGSSAPPRSPTGSATATCAPCAGGSTGPRWSCPPEPKTGTTSARGLPPPTGSSTPRSPSPGPRQVLEYLGRYTHKVAISDYRILQLEDGRVTFRYRDRADGDTEKTMTLSADAFIGRFLLHILPPGFQKIRFYGWMARNVRTENLRHIRQALNVPPPDVPPKPPRIAPDCPACGKATLLIEGLIGRARGPPHRP
ncbi:MAG: transposase [Kiritimatiellae bacterium]|nr:transposase [Kiritimatiellia bacterium]